MKLENILVPLDGSSNADRALDAAILIAEKFQSEIFLINVVDRYIIDFATDVEGFTIPDSAVTKIKTIYLENAKKILNEKYNKIRQKNIKCTYEVLVGDVAEKIINFSKENSVDLIVIGARGLSKFKQLMLGSVSYKVSIGAKCPVMIVK